MRVVGVNLHLLPGRFRLLPRLRDRPQEEILLQEGIPHRQEADLPVVRPLQLPVPPVAVRRLMMGVDTAIMVEVETATRLAADTTGILAILVTDPEGKAIPEEGMATDPLAITMAPEGTTGTLSDLQRSLRRRARAPEEAAVGAGHPRLGAGGVGGTGKELGVRATERLCGRGVHGGLGRGRSRIQLEYCPACAPVCPSPESRT
jgi:hypothetical protein